mgnify:CR=1 FL=1
MPSLTIQNPKTCTLSTHTSLVISSKEGPKLKTFFHFRETLDADCLTLLKPQIPYVLVPADAAVAQQSQNASGSHDFRKDRA